MIAKISFKELSDYIVGHYGKQLYFSKASGNAFRVAVKQNVFIKTIEVGVSLSIEAVAPDAVTIKYDGGFGIDMMISGVMAFIKAKLPELAEALVSEEGHRIKVCLSKLAKTQKIVKAISLQRITVEEDGLIVTMSLK